MGNWSVWVTGATVRADALQETNGSVHFSGGWSLVHAAGLSGGAERTSTSAGSSVRVTLKAQAIAWVARPRPGAGLAQVFVDGKLRATVDLGASSLGTRHVVFATSWTSPGKHSVVVRNLGTTTRPLADADAFLVLR